MKPWGTGIAVLLTLFALSGMGTEGPGWAAEAIRVRDLSLSGESDGRLRLSLKTSGAVTASSCGIRESAGASLLVLELPRVESALKPAYDFPEMSLGTIRVSPLSGADAKGVKVEVPLQGAALEGWQASGDGIDIYLRRAAPQAIASHAEPYKVGIGDRLEMSVFGHEDLHQTVEVLADGTMALPLVGVMPAAGRSLSDIRGELEKKLRDYLVDPQVSLDIKDYQSQPVSVVGEVEKPGTYYLKGPTTVVDIIAQAGWMTHEAGSEVTITRHEMAADKGSSVRQIVVKKEDLVGTGAAHSNPAVLAGDVITVGPKQYFYIRGEVSKPGQYILENNPTLMKAMSLALGLTPYARKRGIELIRTVNGVQSKTVYDLKAIEERKIEDVPLMADDQIVVPRRLF